MGIVVASVAPSGKSMRYRNRSYMAFALTPEPPIADWLAEIDGCIRSSTGFFVGRPVLLDLSAVTLSSGAVAHLIAELQTRDIRIVGLEGADPSQLGPGLPPVLKGGRTVSNVERQASRPHDRRPSAAKQPGERSALLLESPVRSGQSVVFPSGDVTVLGAIASGAEVVAGGSIHVYGALRGRAMAGAGGNLSARIFCSRLEAELLAIDGFFRTTEELDGALLGRPAQAWLDDQAVVVATLD